MTDTIVVAADWAGSLASIRFRTHTGPGVLGRSTLLSVVVVVVVLVVTFCFAINSALQEWYLGSALFLSLGRHAISSKLPRKKKE